MVRFFVSTLMAAFSATLVAASPLKLEPADPQPEALTEGLAVSYVLDANPRTLDDAFLALDDAEPGEPLLGLDYRDTEDGEPTLTSGQAHKVIAAIEGYIKFDAPGVYTIDFMSNDGLQMSIGGQEVVYFDGVHPCEQSDPAEVEVPQAGWYALEGVYFQRKGSACLMMRAGIGEPEWVENASFGFVE